MNDCWENIKTNRKKAKKEAQTIAEKEFGIKPAGKELLKIYERILKGVKANPKKITERKNPMIYNFIAYAPGDKEDLGKTYNDYMELLPNDDDWACFLDHDAMTTTVDWYKQLQDIIAENPSFDCFSAVTNRIGNPNQKVAKLKPTHDIVYH